MHEIHAAYKIIYTSSVIKAEGTKIKKIHKIICEVEVTSRTRHNVDKNVDFPSNDSLWF